MTYIEAREATRSTRLVATRPGRDNVRMQAGALFIRLSDGRWICPSFCGIAADFASTEWEVAP